MKSGTNWLLTVIVFLSSCSPLVTQAPINETMGSTGTESPSVEISTPTPAPVRLPVDRFSQLPDLQVISLENSAKVEEVAQFYSSKVTAHVSDDGNRLVLQTSAGVQGFSLPDLKPTPFAPLKLSFFSRTSSVSPDGKYIARTYQGADHPLEAVLVIFDTETGKETCRINSLGVVTANEFDVDFFPSRNTFSLSGDLAVSGAGNRGKSIFWSLDTCKQAFYDINSDLFIPPSISDDGRYAASVKNEQVAIYDMDAKKQFTVGEPGGEIRGVGFNEGENEVIISYRTKTFIYDMTSLEQKAFFDANVGNYFASIDSFDDGKWILVQGGDKNYFWNSNENRVYMVGEVFGNDFSFENGIARNYKSVFGIETGVRIPVEKYGYQYKSSVSADGSFLAVGYNAPPFATDIFDMTTGEKIASIPDTFAPVPVDRDSFLVSSPDGIFLVQYRTGEILKSFDGNYLDGVSVNGRIVVWNALGEIGLLNLQSGEVENGSVLPFFPLGPVNYMQSQGVFSQWDAASHDGITSALLNIGTDANLESFAVSGDYSNLIQEGAGQAIQIYQGTVPSSTALLGSFDNKPFPAMFKFSPNNSMIAGGSNQLILWDAESGAEIKRFSLSIGLVMDMKFSQDGTKIVLSGNTNGTQANVFGDLSLLVFDVAGRKIIQRYDLKQDLRKTGCNATLPFAMTADSSHIYTLTQDCLIGLFDVNTFSLVRSFGLPYKDYALSFALSPDEKILAVARAKNIELWDVGSGDRIAKISIPELAGNYDNYFHRVSFTPDGKAIVVKSGVLFSFSEIVTVWGVVNTP